MPNASVDDLSSFCSRGLNINVCVCVCVCGGGGCVVVLGIGQWGKVLLDGGCDTTYYNYAMLLSWLCFCCLIDCLITARYNSSMALV